MSLYELQRCMFDHLRRIEATGSTATTQPSVAGYELTPEERRLLEHLDVRGLYLAGVHPVLLNSYARAMGMIRSGYRQMLEDLAKPQGGNVPWRK